MPGLVRSLLPLLQQTNSYGDRETLGYARFSGSGFRELSGDVPTSDSAVEHQFGMSAVTVGTVKCSISLPPAKILIALLSGCDQSLKSEEDRRTYLDDCVLLCWNNSRRGERR